MKFIKLILSGGASLLAPLAAKLIIAALIAIAGLVIYSCSNDGQDKLAKIFSAQTEDTLSTIREVDQANDLLRKEQIQRKQQDEKFIIELQGENNVAVIQRRAVERVRSESATNRADTAD